MSDRNSLEVINFYPPHQHTLSSLLESRAQRNDNKDFLLQETERKISWREFYKWAATLSLHLKALGLVRGDRVIVCMPNCDAFVALFFALADQALTLVPLNPDFNESEMRYVLEHSEAKFAFVDNGTKARLTQAAKDLPIKIEEFSEKYSSLRSDLKLQNRATGNDTCLILYTSGTTGFPKGVMHSQKSAVIAGEAFVDRMHLQPDDRLLCVLPFFHINALFYSLMGATAAGASLIITPKFSASKFWKLAAETKATQVNLIAAVGSILSKRPAEEFCKHSIQKIYGAPVSEEMTTTFQQRFHVPIVLEGYGMTEIPGAINNQIAGKSKIGTMGVAARHPNPNFKFTELRIVDENEKDVSAGETGELIVKTPIIMQGYFRNPEETKLAFTEDAWFKSGDYVRQDADGFYVFVSRKKDIIRRRGENVSGAELDRVFLENPHVQMAAAIGIPSSLGEEEILLFVVSKSAPNEALAKELYAWAQTRLSQSKLPKYIIFRESLPLTATARVAKYQLKKEKLPDLLKSAIDLENY